MKTPFSHQLNVSFNELCRLHPWQWGSAITVQRITPLPLQKPVCLRISTVHPMTNNLIKCNLVKHVEALSDYKRSPVNHIHGCQYPSKLAVFTRITIIDTRKFPLSRFTHRLRNVPEFQLSLEKLFLPHYPFHLITPIYIQPPSTCKI